MQTVSTEYNNAINAKKRTVRAKLENYIGDTLVYTYDESRIVDIEIQRTGEDSKFFGFGVSHKVVFKVLDPERTAGFLLGDCYKPYIGLELDDGTIEYKAFPKVYIAEIARDENTNIITITAYDNLTPAAEHNVSELNIQAPYTLKEFAEAAAAYVDGKNRTSDFFEAAGIYQMETEDPYPITVTTNEDGIMTVDGTLESGTTVIMKFEKDVTLTSGTYIVQMEQLSGTYTGNLSSHTPSYSFYGTGVSSTTSYRGFTERGLSTTGGTITMVMVWLEQGTYDNLQVEFHLRERGVEEAPTVFEDETIPALALEYEMGANLQGTESIREVLNDIAEATQTIYYIGENDWLVFKQLKPMTSDVTAGDKYISKDAYMDLNYNTDRYTIKEIMHVTELGDNVSAPVETLASGYIEQEVTQYIRNNPFWDLREDIADILADAAVEAAYQSNYQMDCQWRGDPALEIGDCIWVELDESDFYETKIYSYLVNDTLIYNGGLSQKTTWQYVGTSAEAQSSNPINLGEALNQTYARVDKVNKEIELLASEQSATSEAVASLQINTEAITASVTKVEQVANEAIGVLNDDIYTLTKKVETSMTAEDVQIQIKSELSNGVDKVTTATGFTFNEDGLTIAKTGSEMTTNIDEDGMSIYRDDEEVLTADNQGVIAFNLHARTYLIIGNNSRLEDWTNTNGEARTGCFWIGG